MTLELGTETLTGPPKNLLASKDPTRPGPSVKLMGLTNDTSDSVARGLLEKIWTAQLSFRMMVLSFHEGIVYLKCVQRRTTQNSGIHGMKVSQPNSMYFVSW